MRTVSSLKRIIRNTFAVAIALIVIAGKCVAVANPPEPIPANTPADANESPLLPAKKSFGFTARKKDNATTRDWNRASGRLDVPQQPSIKFPDAAAPRIQFMSATDSEVGGNQHAVLTDSAEVPQPQSEINPDSTPNLSIREQLLNALKAHRESTGVDNQSNRPPGSLTILNSPPQAAPAQEVPPSGTVDLGSGKQENTVPGESAVGLTRTWEKDLTSPDPMTRELARRYLRLEMQLLQIRANQVAQSEPSQAAKAQSNDSNVVGPHNEVDQHDEVAGAPTLPADSVKASDRPDPENPHDSQSIPPQGNQNSEAGDVTPIESLESGGDQTPAAPGAASESTAAEDESILASLPGGAVVVDGPIDRLGLANNLFAVGQYALAFEMYQQTDASQLESHQKFWLEYQLANCLRRRGKTAEASNGYRRLAEKPEAGWLSLQARWWVDTLEEIRVLEMRLAEYAAVSADPLVENPNVKESVKHEHNN